MQVFNVVNAEWTRKDTLMRVHISTSSSPNAHELPMSSNKSLAKDKENWPENKEIQASKCGRATRQSKIAVKMERRGVTTPCLAYFPLEVHSHCENKN